MCNRTSQLSPMAIMAFPYFERSLFIKVYIGNFKICPLFCELLLGGILLKGCLTKKFLRSKLSFNKTINNFHPTLTKPCQKLPHVVPNLPRVDQYASSIFEQ